MNSFQRQILWNQDINFENKLWIILIIVSENFLVYQ